jgi:hypothetical protein
MIVWQTLDANEWAMVIRRALATAAPAASSSPNAFSLGEPDVIERTLGAAGFADMSVSNVREPVYYGADVAAALDWVGGFSTTRAALEQMAPAERERALAALRDTFAKHDTGQGVWLGSRAWLVTARRP